MQAGEGVPGLSPVTSYSLQLRTVPRHMHHAVAFQRGGGPRSLPLRLALRGNLWLIYRAPDPMLGCG